jgi:hypothetical protein
MDNRRNDMHQTQVHIVSTISQGISGSMAGGLESPVLSLPCTGKCKVNNSTLKAGGGWLQVSQAKITSKSWGRSILWRRRHRLVQIFGPRCPQVYSWPAHLAYYQHSAHPSTLATTKQTPHIPNPNHSDQKAGSYKSAKMPQAQLKKAKTEKKIPAKPYDPNSSTTENNP